MNELIPINESSPFPVNARSIHEYLGVTRDYSTWFSHYSTNLIAGTDFTTSDVEP